jgi:UDP-2,3-diacylglucosamine pyrophosphatase LpxH
MSLDLHRERAYYLAHQAVLAQLYDGQVIVIKGDVVHGTYDDATWATPQTRKRYAGGAFFVERVALPTPHVAERSAR